MTVKKVQVSFEVSEEDRHLFRLFCLSNKLKQKDALSEMLKMLVEKESLQSFFLAEIRNKKGDKND